MKKWLQRKLIGLFLGRFKLPRDVQRFAFKKYADRIALLTDSRSLTYAQLASRSGKLVAAWQAMGINKGDYVFAQVNAEKELTELRLAAAESGVILTTFHEAHTPDFVLDAAEQAQPKLLILDPMVGKGTLEEFTAVYRDIPVWQTGPDSCYEITLEQQTPTVSRTRIDPCEPLALGFTSGTTGRPKGLLSSHYATITSLKMVVKNLENPPDRRQVNINCTAIPLVGAGSGLVMPSVLSGGTLIAVGSYSPEKLISIIEEKKVTRLFVTPSQLIDLLEMPTSQDHRLASLKNVIYGTAPMPAAKLEEAIRRFGPIFQQGYGQAEVLPPVSLLNCGQHMRNGKIAPRRVLQSCGLVVPEVKVRISDSTGQALSTGTIGQVHVNTPTRFSTYLDPQQNKGVILDDGYFVTGDYGFFGKEGYLHILDRETDLIHTSSGILYPRLVEEEAHDHPAVKEACLVFVNGKKVLAISIRQSHRNKLQTKIKSGVFNLLQKRLPTWKLPDELVIMDELPRSFLQKVLRREVRDALANSSDTVPAESIP